MENPFQITVYDKAFSRLGWVDAPVSQTWTVRHNQQGNGSIILPEGSEQALLLAGDGCRVVCTYKDEFLMSGPVRTARTEGQSGNRLVTFQVQDDFRELSNFLCWPTPAAAIGSQGSHDKRTGSAEAVLKGFAQANITRLSKPITVAANLNRGGTVTVQLRFQKLVDEVVPLLDQAGIGVRVRQSGSGLVLDCYTPATWPINLSEDAGTLTDLSWTRTPPEFTRVVVGGPGDDSARVHRQRVNSAAETAWGDKIEDFVDARDIKADDPNLNALLDARGDEFLAQSAAKAGISLNLQEGEVFRYGGEGVHVGDKVAVEISPGSVVTDVIRSATLSLSQNGLTVTPIVGERTDDPNVLLVKKVSQALKASRRLQVGK